MKKHPSLKKLSQLRKQIDSVDNAIVLALSKRMQIVKKIGKLKKVHQIPVVQKKRWKDVITTRVKAAQKKGLNAKFVGHLLKTIHSEAVRIQKTIVKKGSHS